MSLPAFVMEIVPFYQRDLQSPVSSLKLHWITLDLKIREMYDSYVKDKYMKMTPYPYLLHPL